jgi:hypothetical protein
VYTKILEREGRRMNEVEGGDLMSKYRKCVAKTGLMNQTGIKDCMDLTTGR